MQSRCADVVVQSQGLDRCAGQVSQYQRLAPFTGKPHDRALRRSRSSPGFSHLALGLWLRPGLTALHIAGVPTKYSRKQHPASLLAIRRGDLWTGLCEVVNNSGKQVRLGINSSNIVVNSLLDLPRGRSRRSPRTRETPQGRHCSERSRPTPLDLRRVSAIKPTPNPAASAAMSVSNVWDS
jgi:hypothetical protein